jgi:hypothetical protein
MSNANITRTPWTTDGKVLRNGYGNSIASGGNNRTVCGDELAASLRLAAAAPDLLAALREVVDATQAYQSHPCDRSHSWALAEARYRAAFVDARAAIAKAEGRS